MFALQPLCAQQAMDSELASLVDAVCMLRRQSESEYNAVSARLQNDMKWTPMSELGALRENECPPAERVPRFKLNRILSSAERSRKYVSTHGDMLNGEDSRYDYSLCERSVKGGRSVTYVLKGRSGRQTFVVVPFEESESGLSATVAVDGAAATPFVENDGVLSAVCEAASADSRIVITVAENSGRSSAFVLLNHNSRRR